MLQVQARKGNGPWVVAGNYSDSNHADKVCKATTRGEWVARIIPINPAPITQLPTQNPDAYSGYSMAVHFFLPTGEFYKTKKGELREKMMRVTTHKVHIKCLRSGAEWVYNGTRRNGKFGYKDTRHNNPSVPMSTVKDELHRMMGDKAYDVLAGLFDKDKDMSKADYDAAFKGK